MFDITDLFPGPEFSKISEDAFETWFSFFFFWMNLLTGAVFNTKPVGCRNIPETVGKRETHVP